MHASTTSSDLSWPEAAIALGLLVGILFLIALSMSTFVELRKTKVRAGQEEDLRRLIGRYEHLAENTVDAQQRIATDLSDVRSRTTSIEQILRTVE